MSTLLSLIQNIKSSGKKTIFPLLDPDKVSEPEVVTFARQAELLRLPVVLVGGSILTEGNLDACIRTIKANFSGKVLLFPGNTMQLSKEADGLLFLSLISGRNPELLIGKHVVAAPYIKQHNLEPLSTGYMLVECGPATSVSYMSQTFPIPYVKDDIALCTALAGEMLGLKCIYMDGGSGAGKPISESMIQRVAKGISIPLIVGGGIRTPEDAAKAVRAGADIVVVGNVLEKSPVLLAEMVAAT